MGQIDDRMQALGLELPPDWEAEALYLPFRRDGHVVYLSGQTCERNGEILCHGPVGPGHVGLDEARAAARVCALNLLHRLRMACDGDLDRVARIERLGGFVNCVPGYPDGPKVIDAASEVFIALWGENGKHARTAVGVAGLPGNAAVEVDAIVTLKDG